MKSVGKVAILMLLIIILSFLSIGILKWVGIDVGPLTKLVPFLSMIIVLVVFLKKIDKKDFLDIGLHNFLDTRDYSVMTMILALLPLFWGIIMSKGIQLKKPLDASLIVILAYCLLISYSEELLYRGYVYHTISISKLKGVISAAAFAGFHFISPEFNSILFILYFLYGVIKVCIFKKINNIWPLILFHLVWDVGATYTDFYSNPIIDVMSLLITLITIIIYSKYKLRKVEIKV